MGNNHKYGSGLPIISKTRTNISQANSSIDKMSMDTVMKRHSKLNMLGEQPYFEK